MTVVNPTPDTSPVKPHWTASRWMTWLLKHQAVVLPILALTSLALLGILDIYIGMRDLSTGKSPITFLRSPLLFVGMLCYWVGIWIHLRKRGHWLAITFIVFGGAVMTASYVITDASQLSQGNVIAAIIGVAAGAFATFGVSRFAVSILNSVREEERRRRQDLLAKVKALETAHPELWIVTQLVSDEFDRSSRSSLGVNSLFFFAGLAIPYVIQFIIPSLLRLFHVIK
jgi:hypothetical protein